MIWVEAEPQGLDKWVYQVVHLPVAERPPVGAIGLACTLSVREGEGVFRVIFDEQNGSSYVSECIPWVGPGHRAEVMAAFDPVTYGAGWSKPDPNARFDPGETVALRVGCNLKGEKVTFAFDHLRWLLP